MRAGSPTSAIRFTASASAARPRQARLDSLNAGLRERLRDLEFLVER